MAERISSGMPELEEEGECSEEETDQREITPGRQKLITEYLDKQEAVRLRRKISLHAS